MVYDENSGGGFLPDYNSNSQSQNGQARPQPMVRAVTIKQVTDATSDSPEDSILIDGKSVTKVKLVGIIRNVTQQNGRYKYVIEDGTGSLQLIKYNDDDSMDDPSQSDSKPGFPTATGDYAEVYAYYKMSAGNERLFYIAHIRPIADYNAVVYHFLEAINNHLYYTKRGSSKPKTNAADEGIFVEDGSTGNHSLNIINAIQDFGDLKSGCPLETIAEYTKISPATLSTTLQTMVDDGLIWEPDEKYYLLC